MANPEINLDAVRAGDDKNDTSPESESLNAVRVLNFLHRKNLVADKLFDAFTVDFAAEMSKEGKGKGESQLAKKLEDVKKIIVDKYHREDVMKERDAAVVDSKLANLRTPPANMTEAEAKMVKSVWEDFNAVRNYSWHLLESEAANKEARSKAFGGETSVGQSLSDGIHEKLGFAREKWDTLSTGQKLLFAGIALFGAIQVWNAKDGILGKLKDTIVTGAKIGGAAWLLNKAWYLFTGESAIDAIAGTAKGSGKSSAFLKESFRTDDKGAEVMSKAFVQIGDLSFTDLAARYDVAAKSGTRKIEGTRMPPEEAFKAMELFFGKYNYEKTVKEYGKYNPPVAFNQVVTIEMGKDPDVKLEESFAKRTAEGVSDYWKRATNYLSSTAAGVWIAEKYEKWFGKKPSPQELTSFVQKFDTSVKTEAEVTAAIDGKVCKDKNEAKKFIDVNLAGLVDTKNGLKYKVNGDGYVYMIVDKPMNNTTGDDKALSDIIQSCMETSEKFLVEKYQVSKDVATKKCTPVGSVFVTDTAKLKYLVKYKIN